VRVGQPMQLATAAVQVGSEVQALHATTVVGITRALGRGEAASPVH
jgi:hypothetical protein